MSKVEFWVFLFTWSNCAIALNLPEYMPTDPAADPDLDQPEPEKGYYVKY